eukprot:CAMPEP_0194702232 /NCGR_PEP_ID=MMETSP0295-20121207/26756_1 /TAXON_ID=39354 /ORGANISM="Heterosigma akashiwo, Strain CCMP2393" /LENGTH=106 /DNA_ID=CAMNT_0039596769 /DNA_START=42 /DNA_END=358 /DNA_ORIENTATION=-
MSELQEAPVYRPTVEEFQDPISYIKKIRPEAEQHGIARIIPPEGWDPPFALDKKKMKFHTRLQELEKLSAESRLDKEFAEKVRKFNFLNETPMALISDVDIKLKWR